MLHQLMMVLLAHLFRHQIQEPLKFETNTKLVCRLPSKVPSPVKRMHVNGQLILLTRCVTMSFAQKKLILKNVNSNKNMKNLYCNS